MSRNLVIGATDAIVTAGTVNSAFVNIPYNPKLDTDYTFSCHVQRLEGTCTSVTVYGHFLSILTPATLTDLVWLQKKPPM